MAQTPRDDVKAAAAVEREIDELRTRTQELLEELERRVRDGVDRARGKVAQVRHAVDVRAHLRAVPGAFRRRPVLAGGVGLGSAVALGLAAWIVIRRRREAARPLARLGRRVEGYRARLIAYRRPPAHHAPLWQRIAAAVLVTVATTLARKMVTRAFEGAPRRELPEPLGV